MWCAQYSRDGKYIIAGTNKGEIALINISNQKFESKNISETLSGVRSVCFAPDGEKFAVCGEPNRIAIFDVENLSKPLLTQKSKINF